MAGCGVNKRSQPLKDPFRSDVLRRRRLFLLSILVPALALLGVTPAHPQQPFHPSAPSTPSCQKLSITAEARAGQEWSAPIGQGWLLRLVPIAPSGQDYSGWDLAVSPEGDTAYPDALLLGTPPYGSLSEREIGTTFGLRAQDAIAWQPRHFHFLLSVRDLATARRLFRQLTAASPAQATSNRASADLIQLVTHQPGPIAGEKSGSGQLSILDAKYAAGTADPVSYAQQWAAQLGHVSHTVVETGHPATARGELLSIRFTAALWLPRTWKLPADLQPGTWSEQTTCPE
jgi:hypothetical protein